MAVESVLTFAAQGILTKLTDLAAQEFRMAWGFKAELRKLRESLPILQGSLDKANDAAEQAKDGGKAVEDWVKKLKHIADEADDVLEEINYEFLWRRVELQNQMGKKVLNFLSASNPILFRQKMAHRIRKISASLAELKNDSTFVGLGLVAKDKDPTPQGIREDRVTDAFFGKNEIFIGRNAVVSDIVTTLTNSNTNEQNLSVMAIVGMPGLGKTTLAKSVYNEGAIDDYFNKKLWVCVSNTFNVHSILTAMLGKVAPTQQALLTDLQKELKEQKYLLVLDDVWNEESEKWERLMSCLSKLNSAPGSKIIVTTRSGIVASLTETLPRPKLELLSTDECWSILKHYSYGSSNIPPHLESIGREIAEKCDGLPLMAKVLGGILRSKNSTDEWLSIQESKIWALPEGEDRIMSILREKLVQLWMAEGFLHSSNVTMDEDGVVITCKMHDLVHDLAELVSKSVGKLRSLFSNGEGLSNSLSSFNSLHVLNLYEAEIVELPSSIGRLKHLRYLDVSRTEIKELPKSIGKLYNLQTLRMCGMWYLERFPKEMENLIKLRHVYFDHDQKVPFGMRRLTRLQTLRYFNLDKERNHGIDELGGLNQLKGELTISSLEHVKDKDEAKKSNLVVKANIRKLTLKWGNSWQRNNKESDVDAIEKCPKSFSISPEVEDTYIDQVMAIENICSQLTTLTHLEIRGATELTRLPVGMLENNHNLRVLHIDHCNELSHLPDELHTLRLLEELTLKNCPSLEFIPITTQSQGMPCLRKLKIKKCEKLSSWPSGLEYFTSLQELHIQNLKHLPVDGLQTLVSLEELTLKIVPSLEFIPITTQSQGMPCLRIVNILNCEKLSSWPSGLNIAPLFRNCILKIVKIGGIYRLMGYRPLVSLEKLTLKNCTNLEAIPNLDNLTSLRFCLFVVVMDSQVYRGGYNPAHLLQC
ncbi:unnamed protein product [Prunus armeniaca]|uniref:AAA+ ATPase domain-containing protein n=1 Tax=Prunus armeniaca TaxID=36596 RepID=A0A6J5TID3_PRUAR|nr:unnamed protein product [Prunus armeniaca]